MKKIVAAIVLLTSAYGSTGMCGESGYVYQGKSFVVYKDGEKIGEWPNNSPVSDSKNRKPANVAKVTINDYILVFEDDGVVRCYGWGFNNGGISPDTRAAPFCVKK